MGRKLQIGINDLESQRPELTAIWHPAKNGALRPHMVSVYTSRKIWWQHEATRQGVSFVHEWQAVPKNIRKVPGCPICHGRKVTAGYNDLQTSFPELCREWDHAGNAALGITPETVTPGSNRRVSWICARCGCSWKTTVINRTKQHTGCPKCAQREQTSFPEQAIWFCFKNRFDRCINRDRSALEKYELDIYLPDFRFAVEYCGKYSHAGKEKRISDEKKREECAAKGIHLITIYENDLLQEFCRERQIIYCIPQKDYRHLEYVMDCLSEELERLGMISVPMVIDLNSDETRIREQFQQAQISGSIAQTHPHLAAEWDDEMNGRLKPQGYTAGSQVSVYWKHQAADRNGAACIHRWRASISRRTQGRGCPICAGKIVQTGFNDLQSFAPPFLAEWDEEENDLSPREITAYSRKKVWWKHAAAMNGEMKLHRWKASPAERMRGNGCGICAGKIIEKGINDLVTTHLELAAEWDAEKNKLPPGEISHGFDKKVWWRHTVCRNGEMFVHSWEASPNSRTNMRSGCPYCTNKKALPGYNDLESSFPDAAKLWDHARNDPLTPRDVTAASAKKVYWTDRENPIAVCDRTKYLRKKR